MILEPATFAHFYLHLQLGTCKMIFSNFDLLVVQTKSHAGNFKIKFTDPDALGPRPIGHLLYFFFFQVWRENSLPHSD